MNSANWIEVCNESEIEIDDLRRFDHEDKTFCIYKLKDGIYATDGICTHEEVHLEDGLVMHNEIECPMHQGIFDIKTGKAVSEPACVDLKVYETKVENSIIYIKL
tara:strand:- start:466 stop:780 length:315 start_codon:yes stop_codon:yes gene_type:complete